MQITEYLILYKATFISIFWAGLEQNHFEEDVGLGKSPPARP